MADQAAAAPAVRPAPAAAAVPDRRHGPQGRRRRPAARQERRGSAAAPGEGSRPVGADPVRGASAHDHHGQRVVSGRLLLRAANDIFLGWERLTGIDGRQRDFCIRQLRDPKGIAEPQLMVPGDMRAMGEPCGATLVRARSGDRIGIAAHLGTGDAFDRALTEAVHIGRVPREAP